jgi:toxin ParE1/3/4
MPSLKISQSASRNLEKIANLSFLIWGEKQTHDYLEELEKAFYLLLDNPYLGKERTDIKPGFCCLVIKKHIIFYQTNDDTVEILRILHGCMDVTPHFL